MAIMMPAADEAVLAARAERLQPRHVPGVDLGEGERGPDLGVGVRDGQAGEPLERRVHVRPALVPVHEYLCGGFLALERV